RVVLGDEHPVPGGWSPSCRDRLPAGDRRLRRPGVMHRYEPCVPVRCDPLLHDDHHDDYDHHDDDDHHDDHHDTDHDHHHHHHHDHDDDHDHHDNDHHARPLRGRARRGS